MSIVCVSPTFSGEPVTTDPLLDEDGNVLTDESTVDLYVESTTTDDIGPEYSPTFSSERPYYQIENPVVPPCLPDVVVDLYMLMETGEYILTEGSTPMLIEGGS